MLHTIQGYLHAFEGINVFGNHGPYLTLEVIPPAGDVEERVERFIREPRGSHFDWVDYTYPGTPQFEFELTPLADWHEELTMRGSWLLDFWRDDARRVLDQEIGSAKGAEVAVELLTMMERLFGDSPVEAWTLRVRKPDHGYWMDVAEYDYVFQAGEALYWMHFGISD
jgi:hypothetical protein